MPRDWPLLAAGHQRPWAWQTRIGDMLEGYGHRRMFWNIVDVRDVAEAQILIAENTENTNGQRYNLVATDESGLIKQEELSRFFRIYTPTLPLQAIVKRIYLSLSCGCFGKVCDTARLEAS